MTVSAERTEYYDRLKPHSLAPLWEILAKLLTTKPTTRSLPCLWKYENSRPLLIESGKLITAEEAERRVLVLENPGLSGEGSTTEALYAGLQMILPGEVAGAHRHTASAFRFIIEGDQAYTAVDGEKAYMSAGDLVLTPNWAWHDHGHDGKQPMIWLDGLDIPLVKYFGTVFTEHYSEKQFPANRPAGSSYGTFGHNLRPVDDDFDENYSPIFHYPYPESRKALDAMAGSRDPDPKRGWAMEYIDPTSGGPIMPTLSAFLSLLPSGFTGKTRQTTEAQIFSCAEGSGRTIIEQENGEELVFEWQARDQFVIPIWYPHRHETNEDSVLFSFSDGGVQKLLGLYREAP